MKKHFTLSFLAWTPQNLVGRLPYLFLTDGWHFFKKNNGFFVFYGHHLVSTFSSPRNSFFFKNSFFLTTVSKRKLLIPSRFAYPEKIKLIF